MHARFWLWLALAAACPPAFAANPSFAELLAKAEAQYDAGHRWSPPGDNMVETIAGMMDIISTATPQQLTELSALLAKGSDRPPDATKPEPAAPARPVVSPPASPPKPSPQASARAADLLARGKEAEALGNISGARRLYASAAALGNGAAALSVGRLYDPDFLKQTAMGGIEPDTALARHWYQRAEALGDPEAGRFLQALSER